VTTPWRTLGEQLDAAIDQQWGEAIRIVPWLPQGGPDLSRPVVHAVGAFCFGADVVAAAAGLGGRLNTRLAESEITVSISTRELGDVRQGDHVYALDRNEEEFEVSNVSETVNDRRTVSLLRVPN
jgi:hypothetical protein